VDSNCIFDPGTNINPKSENMELRKELVALLGTWSAKYKDEPGMHVIADLYDLGRAKLGVGSVSERE
jgi:hypothetical protein